MARDGLTRLRSLDALQRVLTWTQANSTKNQYGTAEYSGFVCHIANLFDPRTRAPCECAWIAPYGFVIEDGCAEHDMGAPRSGRGDNGG